MLKDIEISKAFDIPVRQIQRWKRAPTDNYRFKIYNFLKHLMPEEIEVFHGYVAHKKESLKEDNLKEKYAE